MAQYQYIDTTGKQQNVEAVDSATALKNATNIDAHSGVALATPAPAQAPSIPSDPNAPASTGYNTPQDVQNTLSQISTAPDQPEVRNSTNQFDELKKTLTEKLSSPAPVAPKSQVEQFNTFRDQQGVGSLDDELNALDKEYRTALTNVSADVNIEKGRPVATAIINGRVAHITGEAKQALDDLQNRRSSLVDRIKTKNNTIDQIMKFTQQDYENASQQYEKEYSRALNVYQLLSNEEDKQNAQADKKQSAADLEASRKRDDARANIQVIQNAIKDNPNAFKSLDPAAEAQWSRLEMQAGLPTGTIKAIATSKPGFKVDHWVTSGGKSYAFGTDADGKPTLLNVFNTPTGTVTSGGAGTGTGTSGSPNTSDANGKYTGTVKSPVSDANLNKLSVALRMPIGEIRKLDTDVQSFLAPQANDFKKAWGIVDDAKKAGEDPEALKQEIKDSNLHPILVNNMIGYIDSFFPKNPERTGVARLLNIF